MQCARCSKKLGGWSGENYLTITFDGEQKKVCVNCFEEIKREYKAKKRCNDCTYFREPYCKKISLQLKPESISAHDYYFVQAEKCIYYLTGKDFETKAILGETTPRVEKETAKETHIIREKTVIVKVRCPYCGKLYDETLDLCPHCGGKR
jgi:hypothetical protein